MANYQESEVVGNKWKRCYNININNPSAPATPHITFSEEDVLQLDSGLVRLGVDGFSVQFDPANEIELINPETMEPIGQTMTEGTIYLALFSKYIAAAQLRDAERAARAEAIANITSPLTPPQP